ALGLPVHYPLLWCLSSVRWCTKHDRRLVSQCPNCGAAVELFGTPGRCESCFVWLGDAPAHDHSVESGHEADVWFACATAQLISGGQAEVGRAAVDCVRNFVAAIVDAVGAGRLDGFRRRMGLPGDMLYRWRRPRSSPSLDMFLTLCARLGVEPNLL